MPIQIHTVYTKALFLRFNDFVVKSRRRFWIVMIVCSALVYVFSALLLAMDAFDSEIRICLIMVLLLDILYPFAFFVLPRMQVKKNKMLNMRLEYTFDVDSFSLQAENQYTAESATVQYAAITKVSKNKSDLYLFLSSRQAYVVDLSALSPKQIDTLKDIMIAKIPQKKIKWAD